MLSSVRIRLETTFCDEHSYLMDEVLTRRLVFVFDCCYWINSLEEEAIGETTLRFKLEFTIEASYVTSSRYLVMIESRATRVWLEAWP